MVKSQPNLPEDMVLSGFGDRRWQLLLAVLVIIFTGLLVFSKLPLQLWDESRQAVNSLEMYQTGLSLRTTFEDKTDLWYTKPPLLVWLIVLSFKAFGVSLFALRLPTTLASIALLILVSRFTKRIAGTHRAAFLAAFFLFSSKIFVMPHASSTADLDVLLSLFLTGSAISAFEALEAKEPSRSKWWLTCGACVASAIMTKGVAGLLFLPGLFLFISMSNGWLRVFRSAGFWGAVMCVALVMAGYYGLRERIESGYLQAVAANEIGGRFGNVIGNHAGPVWFYLVILTKQFSLGPAFLLTPFAGRWLPTEQRQAVGLLNTLAVSFLVVISLAATKLEWYPLPCVPLFSMIAAFTLERCLVATGKPISRIGLAICVGVLVFSFGRCLVLMARNVLSSDPIGRQPITQLNFTNNYQDMFSYLERHSIHSIAVFQTSAYAPIARWHQLLRSGKGLRTVIGSSVPMRELPSGTFLVTCDPALFEILKREGTEVSNSHRWVIIRKRNTRK